MPKQALESLTESMFYLLMALTQGERCGTEITAFAAEITAGRVKIGPATLYTLLGKFEKEGPDWFLRVLIDRDEPLDTDTCEAVSRAIDPILDEADPIDQSYYLEVGSPGLGRRLTRPEHYEQLKGQKCAAHLIRPDEQGRRDAEGILEGLSADGMVTLKSDDGDYTFPVKAAGYVKLCDDEDLF